MVPFVKKTFRYRFLLKVLFSINYHKSYKIRKLMEALILAGGENKRMPMIKGLLKIGGKVIVESNVRILQDIFDRVVVSTNSPDLFFYLGSPLVGDVMCERGPMTGILSAFIGAGAAEFFVTACDMPFINVILIKHIVRQWQNRWDAAIPMFHGKPQPLFGIYSRKVVGRMEKSIRAGERGLRDFLKKIDVLYIEENVVKRIDREGRTFVNINTLDDFRREGGTICSV